MDLSLIIPAYNAEAQIARNVTMVDTYLRGRIVHYEIVVVDDGSKDRTAAAVEALNLRHVRVVTLPQNRGKFAALIAGMKAAEGQVKIFTDADIPFDLEAIPYIYELISGRNFHIVIGDRALPQSRYAAENSLLRRSMTYVFSSLVRLLVTGQLSDTQCGLKGLRGDVAEAIFPMLRARGFAGDVEMLYIALKYNLEIKRIPVRLQRSAPTSVRLITHCFGMIANIAQLKLRWALGRYDSEKLTQIGDQSYWRSKPAVVVERSTGT